MHDLDVEQLVTCQGKMMTIGAIQQKKQVSPDGPRARGDQPFQPRTLLIQIKILSGGFFPADPRFMEIWVAIWHGVRQNDGSQQNGEFRLESVLTVG